jgi:hypothetical protein
MVGFLDNSNAFFALLFPFLAKLSNLNFRADTNAISLMEKIPLTRIRHIIIKNSIVVLLT